MYYFNWINKMLKMWNFELMIWISILKCVVEVFELIKMVGLSYLFVELLYYVVNILFIWYIFFEIWEYLYVKLSFLYIVVY